jgi:hypothetical protein
MSFRVEYDLESGRCFIVATVEVRHELSRDIARDLGYQLLDVTGPRTIAEPLPEDD